MKILMLADTMDIGGAETHVYELSHALSSVGHEVKIFSDGGRTAELLGDKAELLKTRAVAALPFSLPHAAKELLNILREFKPDAVHAHTRKTLFLARAVLKIAPFPLVFTAHAKFSDSLPKRLFTNPPSETVAVSPDIGEHFKTRFGAKEITVIPNGVDLDRFTPQETAKQPLKILHVSRLDNDCSKTAELLCLIAPQVAKAFPDAEICIVGGGSDFEKIKTLAADANEKIGKNTVFCLGARADVLPFLRQSNLFVGVSRAALEAMACGLPTVICGNEGYFGICRRENFRVCAKENFCARGYPKADGQRLFRDVAELANRENDAPFRLCDRIKAGFSASAMAEKTEEVYRRAIQNFRASLKNDAVICGYYGFGNLGDELVLEKIKASLAPLRLSVIGAKGGGRICRLNLPQIARNIRSSSVLVLGGGSLLQNSTSNRSLGYYLAVLKTARFFGRKIMLYANGFGPITGTHAKRSCVSALKGVDTASFRDADSLCQALPILPPNARVYLTCDPALVPLPQRRPKDRIALFLRGEDCTKELLSCLKDILPTRGKAVAASMNEKSDTSRCKLAASKIGLPFLPLEGAEDTASFIASSKLVISSRLHALVLAASAGVPFVALCHDPKLSSFAALYSLPSVDIKSGEGLGSLAAAIDAVLENREMLARKISEITAFASKMAEKDKKELFSLLKF